MIKHVNYYLVTIILFCFNVVGPIFFRKDYYLLTYLLTYFTCNEQYMCNGKENMRRKKVNEWVPTSPRLR